MPQTSPLEAAASGSSSSVALALERKINVAMARSGNGLSIRFIDDAQPVDADLSALIDHLQPGDRLDIEGATTEGGCAIVVSVSALNNSQQLRELFYRVITEHLARYLSVFQAEQLAISTSLWLPLATALHDYYQTQKNLQRLIDRTSLSLEEHYVTLTLQLVQTVKTLEEGESSDDDITSRGKRIEKRVEKKIRLENIWEELAVAQKQVAESKRRAGEIVIDADKCHINIIGRPGTGKTTLCRCIVGYNLWHERFEAIYWISLRNLTRYTQYYDLPQIIARECFPGRRCSPQELHYIQQQLDECKVLLLLDGYDELSVAIPPALSGVVTTMLQYHYHILTCRPVGLEQVGASVQFELLGFDDFTLSLYIEKFYPNRQEQSQNLELRLTVMPSLWEMAKTPLYAELICSLNAEDNSYISEMSLAELYEKMVFWYLKCYLRKKNAALSQERFRRIADEMVVEQTQTELRFLGNIAFDTFFQGQHPSPVEVMIPSSLIDSTIRTMQSLTTEQMLLIGLLQISGVEGSGNERYFFSHFTVQEFFSARHWSNLFCSSDPEAVRKAHSLLRDNKYSIRHEVMWGFAAGLIKLRRPLSHNISERVQTFFQILHEEPHDLIGVRHMAILIRSLNECCGDLPLEIFNHYLTEIAQWFDEKNTQNIQSNYLRQVLKQAKHIVQRLQQEWLRKAHAAWDSRNQEELDYWITFLSDAIPSSDELFQLILRMCSVPLLGGVYHILKTNIKKLNPQGDDKQRLIQALMQDVTLLAEVSLGSVQQKQYMIESLLSVFSEKLSAAVTELDFLYEVVKIVGSIPALSDHQKHIICEYLFLPSLALPLEKRADNPAYKQYREIVLLVAQIIVPRLSLTREHKELLIERLLYLMRFKNTQVEASALLENFVYQLTFDQLKQVIQCFLQLSQLTDTERCNYIGKLLERLLQVQADQSQAIMEYLLILIKDNPNRENDDFEKNICELLGRLPLTRNQLLNAVLPFIKSENEAIRENVIQLLCSLSLEREEQQIIIAFLLPFTEPPNLLEKALLSLSRSKLTKRRRIGISAAKVLALLPLTEAHQQQIVKFLLPWQSEMRTMGLGDAIDVAEILCKFKRHLTSVQQESLFEISLACLQPQHQQEGQISIRAKLLIGKLSLFPRQKTLLINHYITPDSLRDEKAWDLSFITLEEEQRVIQNFLQHARRTNRGYSLWNQLLESRRSEVIEEVVNMLFSLAACDDETDISFLLMLLEALKGIYFIRTHSSHRLCWSSYYPLPLVYKKITESLVGLAHQSRNTVIQKAAAEVLCYAHPTIIEVATPDLAIEILLPLCTTWGIEREFSRKQLVAIGKKQPVMLFHKIYQLRSIASQNLEDLIPLHSLPIVILWGRLVLDESGKVHRVFSDWYDRFDWSSEIEEDSLCSLVIHVCERQDVFYDDEQVSQFLTYVSQQRLIAITGRKLNELRERGFWENATHRAALSPITSEPGASSSSLYHRTVSAPPQPNRDVERHCCYLL